MEKVWGIHNFEDGILNYFSAGDMDFWIKIESGEIWLTHLYSSGSDSTSGKNPPDEAVWTRWALKHDVNELKFVPSFPDYPLVIKPEYSMVVLPEARIQIFTRIASWVRIETAEKRPQLVTELPTAVYSKTWFGTPFQGELSYATTTKARRVLPAHTYKNHLINCGIQIQNKSDENLDFNKFCFRAEHLDIFEHAGTLWGNDTTIVYQGEEQLSDIKIDERMPDVARAGKKVATARKPENRGLASRTFHKIINELPLIGR